MSLLWKVLDIIFGLWLMLWLIVFVVDLRRGEQSLRDARGRLRPLASVGVIAACIAGLALAISLAGQVG